MPPTISPEHSLAELVVEVPSRSCVFERFGLDYCCGGGHTLEEACRKRGVAVDDVVAALREQPIGLGVDWGAASTDELIDHIVDTHHAYLRQELPRLSRLLAEVVRAHGSALPELIELRATFETLRLHLEPHLAWEERMMFPAVRAAGSCGASEEISLLEHDHAEVGHLVAQLADLTDGFDLDQAFCGTHRAALDGLRELTLDLHQHVHEENNILFPRMRALVE